jgi:hypothetical protein
MLGDETSIGLSATSPLACRPCFSVWAWSVLGCMPGRRATAILIPSTGGWRLVERGREDSELSGRLEN